MNPSLPVPPQGYRAICFDLDGTLLPMELNHFLKTYFHTLGTYVERFGVKYSDFDKGMKAGMDAMFQEHGYTSNATVFWEAFFSFVDRGATDWDKSIAYFYECEFDQIGKGVVPSPWAAQAIDTLVAKGYPLVLTTMPLFPERALECRLAWAGLKAAVFSRLTTYLNSTSTKPHRAYYAENLAALGLQGKDVLMVGNNTVEDLAFTQLGADAFLVTDYLIDPIGCNLDEIKHGSLETFAQWIGQLPVCSNPAKFIEKGLINTDLRDDILKHLEKSQACADSGEEQVSL